MATFPRLSGPGPVQTGDQSLVQSVPQPKAGQMGAAIGAGLSEIGGIGLQLVEEARKATESRHLIEAATKMELAAQDFATWQQQNPDETQWEGKAEKMLGDLEGQYSKVALSPDGRARLNNELARFRGRAMSQVRKEAFLKTGQRTLDAATFKMRADATAGKPDEEFDRTAAMVPEAVQPKETMALAAQKYKGDSKQSRVRMLSEEINAAYQSGRAAEVPGMLEKAKERGDIDKSTYDDLLSGSHRKKAVEDLVVMGVEDPDGALSAALEDYKKGIINGPELVSVQAHALGQKKKRGAAFMERVTAGVPLGILPKLDEVTKNTDLSEGEKLDIINRITLSAPNDPVGYAAKYAAVANFQGDEGSAEYGIMLNQIKLGFEGQQAATLEAKLKESVKDKSPDSLTRSIAGVYQQGADDLRSGVYGPWEVPILKAQVLPQSIRSEVDVIKAGLTTDAEKAKIAKEPLRAEYLEAKARDLYFQAHKTKDQKLETFMVDDEKLKADAARQSWEVTREVEAFQKANPKAGPDELRAKFYEFQARRKVTVPIRRPVSIQGDLPPMEEGGADSVNPLLQQAFDAMNYANPKGK